MELIFDWDTDKAQANLKKHRISFEEAKTIFEDPFLLTYPDELHSDLEERYISIGYSKQKRMLLAVHTENDTENSILVRIISSRKANTKERRDYEESA